MQVLGGYIGRFLNVDLSAGTWNDEIPDKDLYRDFIGGYGLGARVLYQKSPAGVDPLSSESVLGFITGPLTGTPAILGSRYSVVGKSPLTGGWGDANSGGEFGPFLKFAGYDAIFMTGASIQPVYLLVQEGHIDLQPADDLWGMDTLRTVKMLEDRHGPGARVACIGPAGERLMRIASIMNDGGRAAARSGLGAVMGSKHLKAIVVKGNRVPTVMNPDQVKALREIYLPLFKTGETAQILRKFGTSGVLKMMLEIGRTPIKNFRGTFPQDFPNLDVLDGPAVIANQLRRYACWRCNQACGGIVHWESGEEVNEDQKSEYESLGILGTNCQITDLKAVMTMNKMCNLAGMDTISAGGIIAFAMECYENGFFNETELDGLTLNWGEASSAVTLLERIIERKGLGDLLAEGVWRASQIIGRGSEAFAMHAGGQELPAHDPRHMPDFGISYQISPTPGRHTQGGVGSVDMPPDQRKLFGLDTDLEAKDPVLFHAKAYAVGTAFNNVVNAAGLCSYGPETTGQKSVVEFISAITGWDFDMDECLKTGERIEMMRYLFCLREGYNPLQVQITPRALGLPPLTTGPTAGVTVNIDEILKAYLDYMEMDPISAMPGASRLADLGLDHLEASPFHQA
jgi:aldehyde:ferredoxin oxidoreductase